VHALADFPPGNLYFIQVFDTSSVDITCYILTFKPTLSVRKIQVYRSTRSFISDRQEYSRYELKTVQVLQRGSKDPKKCCDNAIDECHKSSNVRLISGWTITPVDPYENTVAIVQHWWNQGYDSVYFDSTLEMNKASEYVVDLDLLDFAAKNEAVLDNNVAISLLKIAGNYYGVDEDESGLNHFKIPSLETSVLYRQTQFNDLITFRAMPSYPAIALCR